MAVYTEVALSTLQRFLGANYDLGDLISAEGIAEGLENTNYRLQTTKGHYILTLFEKRAPEQDLPFFMSLMDHLAGAGFPCPLPIKARNNNLLQDVKGKKAVIVTFVPGKSIVRPSSDHCRACGKALARMHLASEDFKGTRPNPLDLDGCQKIYKHLRIAADKKWPGFKKEIADEISFLLSRENKKLPIGIIHADLFPDNVHFEGATISGIIDFYFACTDALAFDIAVTVNSWCFDGEGKFRVENFAGLLAGYQFYRKLETCEKNALPSLMRRAALRFLLTRTQDWLFPREGVLGAAKDPGEYMKILSFHRKRRHIDDYME